MLSINEQSALFLTFTFTDENGAPLIPTSADWRLDDLTNDVEVVPWTSLTPASTIQVTVSAQDNLIATQTNVHEKRVATVRMNEGLSTEANERKFYRIKNLKGVT